MKRQAAFELAKQYALLGIPAFPIKSDKMPATANGFKDATIDESKLLDLFKNTNGDIGVGLWPGPAGYVVLDVDDKGEHRGSPEWIAWQEKYEYVDTITAVTASGGFHYWFRKLDQQRSISNTKSFKDIDVRADGGYVVAPGTYFENGSKWVWASTYRIEDLATFDLTATVPQWLDNLLETANVSQRGEVTQEDIDDCGPEMYDLLVKLGAHSPKLRTDNEGNKSIYLSRPGKGEHESVSVGNVNYNVAKFFTSSWSVPEGPRAGQQIPIGKVFNVEELTAWLEGDKTDNLTLNPIAFRGVLGDAVKLFDHTEADPAAILLALLTGFGNLVGRSAYVENVHYLRQYPALFTLVVGASGRARKSAAFSMSRKVLREVDTQWAEQRMMGGFGSGQMIIKTLRDAVAPAVDGNNLETTTIRQDERLFVGENEFGNVLKTVNSENSVYSEVLRNGYDAEKLENRTKGSGTIVVPEGAYHLCLFANITGEELQSLMNRTELYNGFGNRFLYVWAKRTKMVAFSDEEEDPDEVERIGKQLAQKIDHARSFSERRMYFSAEAEALWRIKYVEQESDCPGGVLETVIARSSNHTQRLALIYALADGADKIELEHLEAALAVWDYCRATAAHVFKNRPSFETASNAKRERVKVKIVEYLFSEGSTKKTPLKAITTSHSNAGEFDKALIELLEEGTIETSWVKTGAAPAQVYSLVTKEE